MAYYYEGALLTSNAAMGACLSVEVGKYFPGTSIDYVSKPANHLQTPKVLSDYDLHFYLCHDCILLLLDDANSGTCFFSDLIFL